MYDAGSMTQHMMSEVQRMTNDVMAPWSHIDHLKPAFEEEDDELINNLLLADPGAAGEISSTKVEMIAHRQDTPSTYIWNKEEFWRSPNRNKTHRPFPWAYSMGKVKALVTKALTDAEEEELANAIHHLKKQYLPYKTAQYWVASLIVEHICLARR